MEIWRQGEFGMKVTARHVLLLHFLLNFLWQFLVHNFNATLFEDAINEQRRERFRFLS